MTLTFNTPVKPDAGRFFDTNRAEEIPAGPQYAVIVSAKEREHNGKRSVSCIYAIVAPGQPHHGAAIYDDFWLTEAALGRLAGAAKDLGALKGDPESGDWGVEVEALQGKPCKILINEETQLGGKTRKRVGFRVAAWPEDEQTGDFAGVVREWRDRVEKRGAGDSGSAADDGDASSVEVPF